MKALVVANFKLNGSQSMLDELLATIKLAMFPLDIEVVVCPTFVHLAFVYSRIKYSEVLLGAQDVSAHDEGAYTGEVSASMLAESGCEFVIIGHSERRQYQNESNELIAEKHARVTAAKLTPILCIGETLEEYKKGKTREVLKKQLQLVLKNTPAKALANTIFAYEPVWAIGTGLTPTPQEINEVHAYIRSLLKEHVKEAGASRILYGGSVKATNAGDILRLPEVNGVLIGSASLKGEEFVNICERADEAQYLKTQE